MEEMFTSVFNRTISLLFLSASLVLAHPPFFLGLGGAGAVKAAAPTFSPNGFTSPGHGAQTVTIATTTPGANIRYTKDGTTPTFSYGTLINASSGTASVPKNADTTLQAVAFTTASDVSDVAGTVYGFAP